MLALSGCSFSVSFQMLAKSSSPLQSPGGDVTVMPSATAAEGLAFALPATAAAANTDAPAGSGGAVPRPEPSGGRSQQASNLLRTVLLCPG